MTRANEMTSKSLTEFICPHEISLPDCGYPFQITPLVAACSGSHGVVIHGGVSSLIEYTTDLEAIVKDAHRKSYRYAWFEDFRIRTFELILDQLLHNSRIFLFQCRSDRNLRKCEWKDLVWEPKGIMRIRSNCVRIR